MAAVLNAIAASLYRLGEPAVTFGSVVTLDEYLADLEIFLSRRQVAVEEWMLDAARFLLEKSLSYLERTTSVYDLAEAYGIATDRVSDLLVGQGVSPPEPLPAGSLP